MKIQKKLTSLLVGLALAYPQTFHAYFNDDFEEDFMQQMHTVEKNIQDMQKSIQASFNQFHHKFFHDLDDRTRDISGQISNPQNLHATPNGLYYQQSSNSLSFANQEKSIKIIDTKNQEKTLYIINVTEKIAQKHGPQGSDNLEALKSLQAYMQKAFHSKQAEAILQECINAISQEQKNKLVNIESSTDDHQTSYRIEISLKENNDGAHDQQIPVEASSTQVINKKKHRSRNKNAKNS